MGSVTIIGAIDEGLRNDPDLLLIKSLMDGISSIALASTMGIGVAFFGYPLVPVPGRNYFVCFICGELLF